MEEKLLEILEQKIQELNSRDNELREIVIAAQEDEEKIQDEVIAGLLRDRKQLEEAINSEKSDYIKAEYNSDLERVNQAIDDWEQTQLQSILTNEQEIENKRNEETALEEYRREKTRNEEYNQNMAERKNELEHRKSEAETALNALSNYSGQTIERKELESDLEKISAELEKINNEQEMENNRFAVIESRYNDLCNKYNVKEIMEKEEAKRKAEEEAKRKAEEEAKRKAEEEAKRKAEEEAKRKAEEEAKRKAEEAKRKAEEEAKRKAEEEAKRRAEEEAKRKAEEEAKRKAAEEKARQEEAGSLAEIEKALNELAKQEAEKDKEKRVDQILQEAIEGMDEDLGSSAAKFQEPNNDKIGRDSHAKTGTTPLNSSDIEPQKKSNNGSPKPKTEITMSNEEYRNYLYEHIIKKDKEFEIEIGETVVIYKDQEPLRPETLKSYKKAAKLNEAYEKDGINAFSGKIINELKYISEDVLDLIKDCSDNKVPIDFMVIFAIKDNKELSNTEKYSLMYEYLVDNLKAYYNYSKLEKSEDDIAETLSKYEKFGMEGNLNITYNMNELSETHLSALLPMSNKLNGKQKEQTACLANKFQRLGTAITLGKYEPNEKSRIAKILNWKPFKKVKQLLLPAPEKMVTPDYDTSFRYEKTMISEDELEAAYQYNDILEQSASDKYKSMREKMGENIKNNVRADVRLSPEELERIEAATKARAEEYKNAGDTKKANKLEELAETHSKQTQNHNRGTDRE